MSSMTIRSARISRPIALGDAVVGAVAAQHHREALERVPGDGLAAIDREVPERLDEVALAGPAGPQTQSASARSIHSSVLSACWVGVRDRRGVGVPGVEGLAGRQPGLRGGASGSSPGRGRRPPRRAGPAGPRRAPSAARRRSRSPPARRGGRRASAAGAAAGRARRAAAARSGVLTVIAPKPSQERVERCSDCCSLARAGNAITCAPWCARIAARSPSPKRPASAATASASSTSPRAVQLGERDGLGELAPQPVVPAAAAAISHCSAPGPIARNACSSSRAARVGRALQRARRARRVVLVVDARPPRRGQRVARDLARPVRRVGVDDDELVAVDARPDALVDRACDGTE